MTLTINIYGNNISVQSSSDTPAIIDQQVYKAVKSIVEKFNDK